METMGDRLKKAREKKYPSATKAADALGIKISTYRAHENGQNEFNPDEAKRYARKFGTTAGYLLAGDTPKSPLVGSFDPDDHVEMDNGDTHEHARIVTKTGDVPNLEIHAGMGPGGALSVLKDESGRVYADQVTGFWSFPDVVKAGWRHMPQIYSMPVTGDSMEPTLINGSYVFVDTSHTQPSPPDLYAVDYGDGLMIKRVELIPRSDKVRVISDNKLYETYEILREEVQVYGRVVAWFQWRG